MWLYVQRVKCLSGIKSLLKVLKKKEKKEMLKLGNNCTPISFYESSVKGVAFRKFYTMKTTIVQKRKDSQKWKMRRKETFPASSFDSCWLYIRHVSLSLTHSMQSRSLNIALHRLCNSQLFSKYWPTNNGVSPVAIVNSVSSPTLYFFALSTTKTGSDAVPVEKKI